MRPPPGSRSQRRRVVSLRRRDRLRRINRLEALERRVMLTGGPIDLIPIATAFTNPIAIEYSQLNGSLLVSDNYANGSPHNFDLIEPDGSHLQFSNASGYTDEVEIAAVQPGNTGGFTVGELFAGDGQPGQIVKISSDGSSVTDPWVTLPGETGLLRGALYVDQTGLFGDDLIVSTTVGDVWKVDSQGNATELASGLGSGVNPYFEGVITVPNDPQTYGPLAGMIVTSDENNGNLYTISPSGTVHVDPLGISTLEDVTLIPTDGNFFGVDYANNKILGASAADFASYAGQILLTQETPDSGTSGLWALTWSHGQLQTQSIPLASGSSTPSQWEHVNFAPIGVNPLPPPDGTLSSLSGSVYDDLNNDGAKQSGEPGLGGVTVTLSGIRDQGGTVQSTTTTASDGSYDFGQLWPGSYTLTETLPSGLIAGKQAVGTLGGTSTDRSFTQIRVKGFETGTGYNFGFDHAPEFTTTPTTLISVSAYYSFDGSSGGTNGEYVYNAAATDPENDTLTYTLLQGPPGMAVDPQSGQLTWAPTSTGNTSGPDGSVQVALQVSDGRGGTAEQDFTIRTIQNGPNTPPYFTSTPITTAQIGVTYTYDATAFDPDLDYLTFVPGTTVPNGLSIDPDTGIVTWTPTVNQLGLNTVNLDVSDGNNNTAVQTFQVRVGQSPGNTPPVITSTPVTSVPQGQIYVYPVTAIDSDGDTPLTYSLQPNPQLAGMTIGSLGGRIEWNTTGIALGNYNVTVVVTDARGGSDQQSFTIDVTANNEVRGHVFNDPSPDPLPPLSPPNPAAITLGAIDTPWNSTTGLAYLPSSNTLAASVNQISGLPNVFNQFLSDGTQVPYSNASGWTFEIMMASARPRQPRRVHRRRPVRQRWQYRPGGHRADHTRGRHS